MLLNLFLALETSSSIVAAEIVFEVDIWNAWAVVTCGQEAIMSSNDALTPNDVLKGRSPASPALQKGQFSSFSLSIAYCALCVLSVMARNLSMTPRLVIIGVSTLSLEAPAMWAGVLHA